MLRDTVENLPKEEARSFFSWNRYDLKLTIKTNSLQKFNNHVSFCSKAYINKSGLLCEKKGSNL